VQEATCTCLAVTLQHCSEMSNFESAHLLQPILNMLLMVVDHYKGAALTSLYDCLATLAITTNLESCSSTVIQILSRKWQSFADTDRKLLPLIECFENCVRSIGPSIASIIEPVFLRCVKLIEIHKNLDSDFVERASNLISAIV
jgi:hypothetical protein